MANLNPIHFIQSLFGGNKPQQKPGFTPAPMQKINLTADKGINSQLVPTIPTYQGNQARLNAQKQLQLTPSFVQNLINAAPYVGQPQQTAALKNPNQAGAEYLGNQKPNQIVLSANMQDPSTVLHEGLHRVYANNPQEQQKFDQAYNASSQNSQRLQNFLASRLSGYSGFNSVPLDSGGVPQLSKIQALPPELQNEAHSMSAEYQILPQHGTVMGDNNQPIQLKGPPKFTGPLNNYYRQYFNPAASLRLQTINKAYRR